MPSGMEPRPPSGTPSNVRDIQRRFGSRPIKPCRSWNVGYVYHRWFRRSWVSSLGFHGLQQSGVCGGVDGRVGYQPYPYKHYESVFTRFYQGHILPPASSASTSARVHLSASGCATCQMDRCRGPAACRRASPYPDPAPEADRPSSSSKKLGFTVSEFDRRIWPSPA